MEKKSKIIVVVGPTASGKTSLAIDIAKQFDGEVISADSRQVYRGLDIGTGKVTTEEMQSVPHHLLDIRDPKETYTAADFRRDAESCVEEIQARGHLPIVAGGTFFYIEALLKKEPLPEVPPNPKLRSKLENMDADTLYSALIRLDSRRAERIDPKNKHRLIRALEIVETLGAVPERSESDTRYDALMLGIDIDSSVLKENIKKRLHDRLAAGMVDEAGRLHNEGLSYERMDELGLEYRYLARHLGDELSYEEMTETLETEIWHYAKRQRTWLKREKDIVWVAPTDQEAIFEIVRDFIKR